MIMVMVMVYESSISIGHTGTLQRPLPWARATRTTTRARVDRRVGVLA